MTQPQNATGTSMPISLTELVALLVAMTAVVALAIDMMLPALDDIAGDLGVRSENDQQFVIGVYLTGFGFAQLFYGPLSDRFGRKIVIQFALAFFIVTSLVCTLTPTFDMLLVARFFQGAAAAACRVIATAIARDLTSGRRMAEVMSMVMTAFMAVPVLAPMMGQAILTFAPWRWIFAFLVLFGLGLMVWLQLRLPETLHPLFRVPLRVKPLLAAFRETFSHRLMLGYTLAGAPFFGGLYGFLGSSQQIFVGHFGLSDDAFPFAFAAIAGGIGLSSYANSRLVMRLGQRRLSHWALIAFTVISAIHAGILWSGIDNFVLFLVLLSAAMAFLGLIAANFSALALEPVGHIAGTASAVYGFVTGVIGAAIGSYVGQLYDGTATPLIVSQALMAGTALAIVFWTERGQLFQTGED
ncbi:multidrug effflux MFS transporter [Maricaulis maris]|jgi:DHA1 family bicyclomycin/chloramphenicol resistance-like MFS transporter|uniref:multidrug effflux MFS transporter n=1 Tax=Maricaulis maris TaxID=74318 RepID=UPI0026EE45F1|nr:multidrug effflux MFS transporter [Maricaulis maris]